MYNNYTTEQAKQQGFTGYMVEYTNPDKSFDYQSIYRSKDFLEMMNHFDLHDDYTRKVLLAVNEADQTSVSTSLANRLYKHIVDKVDDVDFGTIPLSKGDFTKIDRYNSLKDCINIIGEIMVNYKQPTDSIDTVKLAMQNLIDRADTFKKAFKLNIEMPILVYNTIALSIVASVSYLISATIEFVKLPGDQGFEIALNKTAAMKTRDHLLFTNLKKFNSICAKGDFDKAINLVIAQNIKKRAMHESITLATIAAITVGVIASIIGLLYIMRSFIYYFYYSQIKASQYFDAQSSLISMNALNIENNLTIDDNSRKEIAKKQNKVAEFFKKLANKFNIEAKTSESKANKDVKSDESKKYKINDVMDTIPDSATAMLF